MKTEDTDMTDENGPSVFHVKVSDQRQTIIDNSSQRLTEAMEKLTASLVELTKAVHELSGQRNAL